MKRSDTGVQTESSEHTRICVRKCPNFPSPVLTAYIVYIFHKIKQISKRNGFKESNSLDLASNATNNPFYTQRMMQWRAVHSDSQCCWKIFWFWWRKKNNLILSFWCGSSCSCLYVFFVFCVRSLSFVFVLYCLFVTSISISPFVHGFSPHVTHWYSYSFFVILFY